AEEVELPIGTERALVERRIRISGYRSRRPADARAAARRAEAVAQLRIKLRARRGKVADESIAARGGDHEIEIVDECLVDERGEHRIVEALPPAHIGDVGRLRVGDAPRPRRIDGGPDDAG